MVLSSVYLLPPPTLGLGGFPLPISAFTSGHQSALCHFILLPQTPPRFLSDVYLSSFFIAPCQVLSSLPVLYFGLNPTPQIYLHTLLSILPPTPSSTHLNFSTSATFCDKTIWIFGSASDRVLLENIFVVNYLYSQMRLLTYYRN